MLVLELSVEMVFPPNFPVILRKVGMIFCWNCGVKSHALVVLIVEHVLLVQPSPVICTSILMLLKRFLVLKSSNAMSTSLIFSRTSIMKNKFDVQPSEIGVIILEHAHWDSNVGTLWSNAVYAFKTTKCGL